MEKLKIKSIKKTGHTQKVYDLSVENNHNFFIGKEGNVLTHNCDYLTPLSQSSLRFVIEEFSQNTRFILTCNYFEKIIEPIKSRCKTLKLSPPSKTEVAVRLDQILKNENIKYKPQDLAILVNRDYPDMRKIINNVQFFSNNQNKELILDSDILINEKYINNIILKLKENKNSYHTLKEIRQLVLDSNINDYGNLYKALYERIDEYSDNINGGLIIITLEEYLYKSNFIIDKEINIIACISKILEILKT